MTEDWHSNVVGDDWEHLCHILLHLKYVNEYQSFSSLDQGDKGIDGLVRKDKAIYQMYGMKTSTANKPKAVKDKIREDLKKLNTYKVWIEETLGESKINKWILLLNRTIPSASIISYIEQRRIEVLSWNLPFIEKDFQIIICEPTYLQSEYIQYTNISSKKKEVQFKSLAEPAIESLRENQDFARVLEKFKKIANDDTAMRRALEEYKKYYINGDVWQQILEKAPLQFEELESIKNATEHEAVEASELGGTYDSVMSIKHILHRQISDTIGNIFKSETLFLMSNYVISEWYVRCPIDFKEVK